jgi:hypothetical protein
MHEDVIISNFEVEVGEQCEQTHSSTTGGFHLSGYFLPNISQECCGETRLDFPLNQLELNCDVRGALET